MFFWGCCGFLQAAEIKLEKKRSGARVLLVDKKPFLIKGVAYHPIPPGKDYNYNFWKDLSSLEKDAALMQKAGFNAVRFYTHGESLEETKAVIRLLHEKYGIYTIMGNWLGFWNYPCPFYGNKEYQAKIKQEVLEVVQALKDEPGLLFWVLGNENNYSFSGKVNYWTCPEVDSIQEPCDQIQKRAQIYYGFVNDVTKAIKKIDPRHPVALGNGELVTLDSAAKYAPDVDALALIFYRGKSFGNIFKSIKKIFDKPVFISEMGCDAYNAFRNEEDQDVQAEFLLAQWSELYKNSVFFNAKEGNCIGGVVFEWIDEWWKHNPDDPSRWAYQDSQGGWSNGSYYHDIKAARNLNMNEEWFGIISWEKAGKEYKRVPRKAYYMLREFFLAPENFLNGGRSNGK